MKNNSNQIADQIKKGSISALSKAITLIESSSKKHFDKGQEILSNLLDKPVESVRIGVSGPPGVGKSTFIESYGLKLCESGNKVAVLAIDPTSKISKGSILGDKTRMLELSKHENSFIRPTPSSGMLGGIASRTKETIQLCEAAGYKYIIVETVGVGQSEINISNLVDVVVLLLNPSGGDELQGIKKGILEIADIIAVNKADTDEKNVNDTLLDYKRAVRLIGYDKEFWIRKVLKCSAETGYNLDKVEKQINEFILKSKASGFYDNNREGQDLDRLEEVLKDELLAMIFNDNYLRTKIKDYKEKISKREISVTKAIMEILEDGHFDSFK